MSTGVKRMLARLQKTRPIGPPWRVTALGDASYRVESHTYTEVRGEDEMGRQCEWSDCTMATARLIAAAPELLTKAKTLIEKLKTMAVHPSHYLELEEAIAKAEGGAA